MASTEDRQKMLIQNGVKFCVTFRAVLRNESIESESSHIDGEMLIAEEVISCSRFSQDRR